MSVARQLVFRLSFFPIQRIGIPFAAVRTVIDQFPVDLYLSGISINANLIDKCRGSSSDISLCL